MLTTPGLMVFRLQARPFSWEFCTVKKMLVLMMAGQLNAWAAQFANQDADDTGNDDRIARILSAAAAELTAYALAPTKAPNTKK